jgi:nitroimidazol reductase NimA-like FMN-containing flavoprotein (pyridoxamine 5'-phosphate oxidase superfamily)
VPRSLTGSEREQFLTEARVGVLSVAADADGRPPLTVPVWYDYRPGGDVVFFTGTGGTRSRKARLLERVGAFSLNVQRADPPYRYVTVECTVVATDRAPAADAVAAIVRRYLPEDVAQGMAAAETADPDSPFVLYTARPDRWLTGDFSD